MKNIGIIHNKYNSNKKYSIYKIEYFFYEKKCIYYKKSQFFLKSKMLNKQHKYVINKLENIK